MTDWPEARDPPPPGGGSVTEGDLAGAAGAGPKKIGGKVPKSGPKMHFWGLFWGTPQKNRRLRRREKKNGCKMRYFWGPRGGPEK